MGEGTRPILNEEAISVHCSCNCFGKIYVLYSTLCFICRPSDFFTVSEDAGIEPRTVASLACRQPDALTTRLDLIHNSARSHPFSARSYVRFFQRHQWFIVIGRLLQAQRMPRPAVSSCCLSSREDDWRPSLSMFCGPSFTSWWVCKGYCHKIFSSVFIVNKSKSYF